MGLRQFFVQGAGTTVNMYPSNSSNAFPTNLMGLNGGMYVSNGATLNLGSSNGSNSFVCQSGVFFLLSRFPPLA